MAGGKGGSQTTSVKIPAWLETAAQQNLARADALSNIGYTPYYGPDVAAMTPMQTAAMQGTNQAAAAFGLPGADLGAGAPAATNYGGVPAYSSGSLYDQALMELQARAPGQYAALRAPFIDPVTGAAPAAPYGAAPAPAAAAPTTMPRAPRQGGGGGGGNGVAMSATPGTGGGYTGLRDMLNGGGPGASGNTFSGGPLSGTLNRIGVQPRSGGSSGMGGGK